jgi:hypothetical protein
MEQTRSVPELGGPAIFDLPGVGMCEIKPLEEQPQGLVLTGPAYGTAEEAQAASEAALIGLLRLSLRSGYAITLQPRLPPPIIFDAGLEMLAQQFGVDTIYCDRLGVVVFEERGTTRFAAAGTPTISVTSTFAGLVESWSGQPGDVTRRALIAYDLYGSSRSESSSRARFLLLVMAVESLAKQSRRPETERKIVQQLIDVVGTTDLGSNRRELLEGGLRVLMNESISESCRQLLRAAEEEGVLADEDPLLFFRDCYRIRGKIVHSGATPTPRELTNLANRLELIVRSLIERELSRGADKNTELWKSEFAEVVGISK